MEVHDLPVDATSGQSKAQVARTKARVARKVAEEARSIADEARKAAEAVDAEPKSVPDERHVSIPKEDAFPESPVSESAQIVYDANPEVLDTRQHRLSALYTAAMGIAGSVAVVAVAVSVVFALSHHASRTRADEEVSILQAARAQVVNLLTVNKDDVDGYSTRVLDGSTGEWRDEFIKNKDAVMEALAHSAKPTTARVVLAGIESRDGNTASVLVSANTAAASSPDQPETSVRMRVNVREDDGQLKISKVEVVR